MTTTQVNQLALQVLRGPARPDLLREECLADLLAATAARRPNHPALLWGARVVTYGELDAASDAVGHALARLGAGPGGIVGLFLPRGADLLIAQAGIAKSAAAWLPFDADTPLDRIETCLRAAGATGLLACRQWLPRLAQLPVPAWAIEDLLAERPTTAARPAPRPADPAYVIYTSGSTGQPKGIVVSQRSICHLLRSENQWLGVTEADRVYQGFSVAFDMSFEEVWLSYLVGASVWIAPPLLVGDPDQLAQALTREGITVVHAVPTLMGLIDDPLPTVRLINLGGEPCPDALVGRLTRPGRRLFNTYGPTETTVTATAAPLEPGVPVTIGTPLPNYGMMVVDDQRRPLPEGEIGELCIFGPGVAIGYLGQPDLTAAKFIDNPLAQSPEEARLYLTGDLGRIEPGGRGPVHCLGRADGQVKLRGFRVELGEIEAALADQPGVAMAAVAVRSIEGIDRVAGFVVPGGREQPNPAAIRRALSSRLPPYMVPDTIELLAEFPRLPSGKADRKRLRDLPTAATGRPPGAAPADQSNVRAGSAPRNEDEAALFAALGKLFPGQPLHPTADFFDDLGGHSLLAARLVSALRADPRYAMLSVRDLYGQRRLEAVAAAMGRLRKRKLPGAARPRLAVSRRRHFLCGAAQALAVPLLVVLHTASWLAPFFTYHIYTGDDGDSIPLAALLSLGVLLLVQLATFGVAIAAKWVIVGRIKPGRYPLWGWAYFRWWLGDMFRELPPVSLLSGTPFLAWYLRALGARIGQDVFIDSLDIRAPDLLTIDAEANLGMAVHIENARVEGGELVIGPVHLGRGSVVDSYAVLENDTAVEAGARLGGLSALAAGRRIPAGQAWEGAPARPVDYAADPLPPRRRPALPLRLLQGAFFVVGSLGVSALFFMLLFPSFVLIDFLDTHLWNLFDNDVSPVIAFAVYFMLALPASVILVLGTVAVAAGLRRLLPRQKAGTWSIHSLAYCRKWLVSQVLEGSLDVLHGLYASVFAATWLRLMGAKVGRGTEVSTSTGIVPDLLQLGEYSFIADGVLLGDEEQRGGWMVLRPTTIGNRSFVGNGAYVPDGAAVPDDMLIGVQTRTPANRQLQPGQTWLGSPPILLPARETLTGFADTLTFHPSASRRIGRAVIEILRLVLPMAFVIAAGYVIVQMVLPFSEDDAWWALAGALGLACCLFALGSFLAVVLLKWTLIGRYRPRAAPMWTPFVWLSEAVTNLYESLAVPSLLVFLRGTPLLPWALRLLGAHVGKRVYLDTTDLTEFDCVTLGDEAELNGWCGPQTHLFEDRVMKIGLVAVGARVTVGSCSTILYDTHVGDGVQLGPLTLVAKGERLPPATRWEGSPAAPVDPV